MAKKKTPLQTEVSTSTYLFEDCTLEIIWITRKGKVLRRQIVAYEPEPVGEVDTPAKQ